MLTNEEAYNAALDINLLKNHCARIYYFGLGFIQVKLDDSFRVHYYTDKLPAITEDIHNHRYDFTSEVVSGKLSTTIYRLAVGETHRILNSSCEAGGSAPEDGRLVDPYVIRVLTKHCWDFVNSYSLQAPIVTGKR